MCALADEATSKPTAAPTASPSVSPTAGPTAGPANARVEESGTNSAGGGGASSRGAGDGNQGGWGGQMPMLLGLVALMILMFWWTGRSRRRQEAKRKELLGSLKKGDKITTIGGIIGTVVEVRENEVVVKTDESSNVRTKFARWAVREVGDGPKGDVHPDEKK